MIEWHPNVWGVAILVNYVIQLALVAFLHGHPRKDPWDFRIATLKAIVGLWWLYLAGAFTGGAP